MSRATNYGIIMLSFVIEKAVLYRSQKNEKERVVTEKAVLYRGQKNEKQRVVEMHA